MAISINTKYRGISVRDSYVSIVLYSIALGKEDMAFSVAYRSFANEDPFNAQSYTAPYSLEGGNPYRQAYEYLKTLPEFEGCIDC